MIWREEAMSVDHVLKGNMVLECEEKVRGTEGQGCEGEMEGTRGGGKIREEEGQGRKGPKADLHPDSSPCNTPS